MKYHSELTRMVCFIIQCLFRRIAFLQNLHVIMALTYLTNLLFLSTKQFLNSYFSLTSNILVEKQSRLSDYVPIMPMSALWICA